MLVHRDVINVQEPFVDATPVIDIAGAIGRHLYPNLVIFYPGRSCLADGDRHKSGAKFR